LVIGATAFAVGNLAPDVRLFALRTRDKII